MCSTHETCVSLQSHHTADHRQTRWPEAPLRRAPASPPTKRWLGVGLSFAQNLADACYRALLWDRQVPCRKPALEEAIHHLKARDGDTWQIQFMNRGFAVFNSACGLELTGFFFPTHFSGTGVRVLIQLFGWVDACWDFRVHRGLLSSQPCIYVHAQLILLCKSHFHSSEVSRSGSEGDKRVLRDSAVRS